jgi:hypothetical protein
VCIGIPRSRNRDYSFILVLPFLALFLEAGRTDQAHADFFEIPIRKSYNAVSPCDLEVKGS